MLRSTWLAIAHPLAALIPWELLDRIGLARIPKWFYDHNWWPMRGWKARDEADERYQRERDAAT